ncbi:MAG: DNA polymerase III subunit delta [Oscillospiraceae bacterium]|nr:DNA polymerase III subunit delta [Oscillospiraceae bacterium]
MKKRKKEPALNYSAEVRKLKEKGPAHLYLLWGEEDYLRDSYLQTLRQICVPEEAEDFQHRVFREAQPDPQELANAMDTLPFFSDRSLIELWDLDFAKLGDAERLTEVLSDIPDYCTVAFVLPQGEEPNGKNKLIRFLRTGGEEIRFTVQDQNMLIRWMTKRFAYYGKGLEIEAAQRLIYLSGDQMKALIPEIEKIAAYAKGEKVTAADVNAVANRIPESDIFELTDAIAERRFSTAAGTLADLLEQRDSSVPAILSMLSNQFRRLFLAKQAENSSALMELCNIKYEFMARRLIQASRGFQPEQLRRAIELCAEADYRIKSEGTDEKLLLKETLMRIALEVSDA